MDTERIANADLGNFLELTLSHSLNQIHTSVSSLRLRHSCLRLLAAYGRGLSVLLPAHLLDRPPEQSVSSVLRPRAVPYPSAGISCRRKHALESRLREP